MTTIRIATRKSKLALWQSEWVSGLLRQNFPDIKIELVKLTTTGDQILDKTLSKVGGKGLFVKELERALLENQADLAVHSLKDMPAELPAQLELSVYCPREDSRDALISRAYNNLASMPLGATIGTASVRRTAQLKMYRSDLNIIPLRGNVDSRISKALDLDGPFDAIILASAGLQRLDLSHLIKQYLPISNFLSAPGQGIVAIETRKDDLQLKQMLQTISCQQTTICAYAERAFNRTLGGSCSVPIAALAELKNGHQLVLHGQVISLDGKHQVAATLEGDISQASDLGERLAEQILLAGGKKIITHVDHN